MSTDISTPHLDLDPSIYADITLKDRLALTRYVPYYFAKYLTVRAESKGVELDYSFYISLVERGWEYNTDLDFDMALCSFKDKDGTHYCFFEDTKQFQEVTPSLRVIIYLTIPFFVVYYLTKLKYIFKYIVKCVFKSSSSNHKQE